MRGETNSIRAVAKVRGAQDVQASDAAYGGRCSIMSDDQVRARRTRAGGVPWLA
jgi:hypothetical protein